LDFLSAAFGSSALVSSAGFSFFTAFFRVDFLGAGLAFFFGVSGVSFSGVFSSTGSDAAVSSLDSSFGSTLVSFLAGGVSLVILGSASVFGGFTLPVSFPTGFSSAAVLASVSTVG
jgi:hypothetical protein